MNRREILKRAAALSIAQSAFPLLSSAQAAEAADGLELVDPELRSATAALLKQFGAEPPLSLKTLPQIRRLDSNYGGKLAPDIPFERKVIPGMSGQPPVTLYVINGGRGAGRPAILHTHGGGFVLEHARSAIATLQAYARDLGCVVVTVDYRLAPETTYKGSIEDNYAGLKWLHSNARALGVDPARIAVMGESAGGGHAALLAITARDRGEVPVAFQCLTYPMLDDRTGSSRAVAPPIGQLVWTAADNRFGWECFLGMEPGTSKVPADAVPARVSDLKGLPPAFIGVGSIDLFVDEDIEYTERLNDASANTELVVVPGAFHGFDLFAPATRIAKRFNEVRLTALRRGLNVSRSL